MSNLFVSLLDNKSLKLNITTHLDHNETLIVLHLRRKPMSHLYSLSLTKDTN